MRQLKRSEPAGTAGGGARGRQLGAGEGYRLLALLAYWRDETRVARFIDDPATADLTPRLDAMVRYARKLTDSVHTVEETDVDSLRGAGLADHEILHVNLIVAYFNFVNRIAVGLCVAPRPEEVAGYRY